jgi:hypothetical protein
VPEKENDGGCAEEIERSSQYSRDHDAACQVNQS